MFYKVYKNTHHGVPSEAVKELFFLKKLKHPNIITLYHVDITDNTVLTLELGDADLHYIIQQEEYDCQLIFNHIVLGLDYCHDHGIIHCDIKPRNIVRVHGLYKLIDFGLATQCPTSHNVVSLWYRAPELLLKQSYSFPIDIWSLGCVWQELLTKRVLYPGKNEDDQYQLIMNGITDDMLTIDPKLRITAKQLKLIHL